MDNSTNTHSGYGHILEGFVPKQTFADVNGTTPRTVDRYRAAGLPWVKWASVVYIGPIPEARAWLEARVRRTTGGAKTV